MLNPIVYMCQVKIVNLQLYIDKDICLANYL